MASSIALHLKQWWPTGDRLRDGEKVSAVVLGKSIAGVALEIASRKLDSVYIVEDDKIANTHRTVMCRR